MRHVRTALTRLKSKAESYLPDGNDIFGYAGINKALIIATIEQIYTLAGSIEEHELENRFEIIFLKRQASEIGKVLNDILDSDNTQKDFDRFLTKLAKLLWATKHTFFVTKQDGLHSEEEILQLRGKINALQTANSELASIRNDYESAFDNFQEKIETVAKFAAEIEEKQNTLNQQVEDIKKKYDNITSIHDDIDGWDEEIETRKTEMNSLSKEIQNLKDSSNTLAEELKKQITSATENQETLNSQQEKNFELLDEIEKTLAGANKKGMAGSFLERKRELGISLWIWGIVFCLSIVGLALISIGLVIPEIKTEIEWLKLSARITIAAPVIWLAWFSAKQYLQVNKIREDYAFKYASAMAYEGHKKAARELEDANLEKALLEMSLFNMEQNPIRLFAKDGHATPINELFDRVKRIKGKASSDGIEAEANFTDSAQNE